MKSFMSFSLPPADALTLNFIAFFAPQHPKGGRESGGIGIGICLEAQAFVESGSLVFWIMFGIFMLDLLEA